MGLVASRSRSSRHRRYNRGSKVFIIVRWSLLSHQTSTRLAAKATLTQTLVMDAGIASKKNVKLLKENGFFYIVVSCSKPEHSTNDNFVEIKDGARARSICQGDEVFL